MHLRRSSIKFWVIFLSFHAVCIGTALATRKMQAPPFYFSDWVNVTSWPGGSFLRQQIIITVTNPSNIAQDVKVTCKLVPGIISSTTSGTMTFVTATPTSQAIPSTPASQTALSDSLSISLTAGRSVLWWCGVQYSGGGTGDVSLAGGLEVVVEVTQSNGHVNGQFLSVLDSSGVVVNDGSTFGMLRNVSRTYLINAGKPF